MYIIGILLLCIFSIIAGPIDAINSFHEGRVALAILQIIITILLIITAILIFVIREDCGDFELDLYNDDEPRSITMKTVCGYTFGFGILLIIIEWFCCLGSII